MPKLKPDAIDQMSKQIDVVNQILPSITTIHPDRVDQRLNNIERQIQVLKDTFGLFDGNYFVKSKVLEKIQEV